MTDETQLRLQIQQEMNREAKIDRIINNRVKKFLKKNRNFKIVKNISDSDVALVFRRDNPTECNMVLTNGEFPFCNIKNENLYTIFYVKNKNKHDSKLHSYANIKNKH